MSTDARSDAILLRSLDHRITVEWRWFTLALVLLTVALVFWGGRTGLQRLDYLLYDFALTSNSHQAPSDDIIIIAIDDASIEATGYWPWRRALHAALLERLDGAKAVGLDVLLADTNPAYPRDDALLAEAIAKHGRVVLAGFVADAENQLLAPLPDFVAAAAGSGFINVQTDADGLLRRVVLERQLNGGKAHHFSLMLADVAQAGSQPDARPPDQERLIAYAGPAGSFRMVPYHAVLDGRVPASAFNDKLVLIGAWAAGLGDTFSVPSSRRGEPMAGVEILANVLQGQLQQHWISPFPQWAAALASILPVLLVCLGLRRLSPRQAFFGSFGTVLAILAFAWLALRFFDCWFAPAASLVGVMLAYPLWSWRSQEAALRHIDFELHRLNTEKLMAGQLLEGQQGLVVNRSLPARTQALYQGVGLLRRSIRQREETLRFLSHDMRSPQSAILALTQLQRESGRPLPEDRLLDRVDAYAHTTLGLVDAFVQFARAESAPVNFRPVNLVDCLLDVCDARWPQARSRQMTIVFEPEITEAWVEGDAAMLARVFGNLVDNAMLYSPNGTSVSCSIKPDNGFWAVSVTDEGRGIASGDLDQIFQPFSRLTNSAEAESPGSGLGLAYVQTVVVRHQGTVSVISQPGAGSTFTVRLPVLSDEQRDEDTMVD